MDGLGPTGGQPAVTPSTTGGPLEASQSLTAHTHVRDLVHGINGVLPRAMTDRLVLKLGLENSEHYFTSV